ncbi:hypothetical protein [Yersinia pekkanenii]|uniref:Uncharacterized protein n=1 Tax=Yersinia pekkanenii TaxID=1288385 RepID=A0A0T9QZX4_9GAMM|nr:hypothetical protein [Yersinia pekkanenii]CNI37598.1 Uncharacterised protein [Yersinia pekkanenii]CRY66640.1 Uncharacterised protein [Yersinia pekkanenii]
MTEKVEITITITNHNDGADLDMNINADNVNSHKLLIMTSVFCDLIKGSLEAKFNVANDLADFAVKTNQCCCDED